MELVVNWSAPPDPVSALAWAARNPWPARLQIRMNREAETDEERRYLQLFEMYRPTVTIDSAVEPAPTPYDLSRLATPEKECMPISGEFLQRMCEYTVTSEEKGLQMHSWLDWIVPKSRQITVCEPFAAEVLENTKSLFVYPEPEICPSVFEATWPALRLLVIHSGDNTVPETPLREFLERHPNVLIWGVNLLIDHPRVRIAPLGVENTMWRWPAEKGEEEVITPTIPEPTILEEIGSVPPCGPRLLQKMLSGKITELPMPVRRNIERIYNTVFTFTKATHPLRKIWIEGIRFSTVTRLHNLPRPEYNEVLGQCHAICCPPGNGWDTHRLWETLYAGAYGILDANLHTALLLAQYPSLPCVAVTAAEEIQDLVFGPSPAPFPVCLLREAWELWYKAATA